MKSKCIHIVFVILLCSAYTYTLSAQVYYYYDNNGNRITTTYTHHAPEYRNDTSKIKIYPNPTNGEVNVAISSFGSCTYASIYIVG